MLLRTVKRHQCQIFYPTNCGNGHEIQITLVNFWSTARSRYSLYIGFLFSGWPWWSQFIGCLACGKMNWRGNLNLSVADWKTRVFLALARNLRSTPKLVPFSYRLFGKWNSRTVDSRNKISPFPIIYNHPNVNTSEVNRSKGTTQSIRKLEPTCEQMVATILFTMYVVS